MLSDEILKFLKENKIKYEEINGFVFVEGNLDLRSVKSIPEDLCLIVNGQLFLSQLISIPSGVTILSGSSIDLCSVKSIESGCSIFSSGDSLNLNSLIIAPECFIYSKGDISFLSLEHIQEKSYIYSEQCITFFTLKFISTSFFIHAKEVFFKGIRSVPESFDPYVENKLYLENLESIDLNWRPKNVKGEIIVKANLKKDLNYVVEMAKIDKDFDFLPKDI